MDYNLTQKDLSNLSDEDLESLASGNVSAMSNQALEHVSNRHELNTQRSLNTTQSEDGSSYINVGDKMHPEIGAWDRFVAKNFASNPESQMGYMKKNYPGLEFKKLKNGELVARGADEVNWQRLDEKGFGLQDLADISTDIGQGVAEGVGGAAAGLATLNPAVGVATAGGLGVASEYAKQGIGSALGVPDNINHGNAVMSGAASTILPGMGKYVAKPAWGAVKKAAPVVGEFMSGIDRELLANINLDEKARNYIQSVGIDKHAQNISDTLKSKFASARLTSGQAIGQNLNSGNIDISSVKQNMDTSLNAMPSRVREGTKWTKDLLDDVGSDVDAQEAIRLKNDYYSLAEGDRSPLGYGGMSAQLSDMSSSERGLAKDASLQLRDALRNSSKDVNAYDALAGNHHELIMTSGDKRLKSLNDKLGTQKYLESWNKNTTKGTDDINDTLISNVKKHTGEDIGEKAREYQSWQMFQDPAKISPNKTRASLTGGLAGGAIGFATGRNQIAGGAGALIGAGAGNVVSSPWAMKGYAKSGKKVDQLGEWIKQQVYLNPYARADKSLINVMGNENNR